MNLQDFKSLFSFKKDLAGFVGVERERFICKKRKILLWVIGLSTGRSHSS